MHLKKKAKSILEQGKEETRKSFRAGDASIIVSWCYTSGYIISENSCEPAKQMFEKVFEHGEDAAVDTFEAVFAMPINAFVEDEQFAYARNLILKGGGIALLILGVFLLFTTCTALMSL